MKFFNFAYKDITGKQISFEIFNKAKCFLIVNVASKCGLTNSNYAALVKLHEKYANQGLEILAFPCNQFGAQEPGSDGEICEFVKSKFSVNFPVFEKVDVNGENTCDLYKYLKESQSFKVGNKDVCKNGLVDDIPWNFAKFLVNRNGEVINYYGPRVDPEQIVPDIENNLK